MARAWGLCLCMCMYGYGYLRDGWSVCTVLTAMILYEGDI